MHFNVLKGAYPDLSQLDKTLPIKSGSTGIERGSVLVIESDEFRPCAATDVGTKDTVPGPMAYYSFQNQADPDVVMAGAITGMPCNAPVEVETDMYNGSPAAGEFLMCDDAGKLQVHTDGLTAVGLVTKAPYKRWSNVATPTGGSYPAARQGAVIDVIAFWSVYIPNLALA